MAVADPPAAACCRGYVSSVEVCVERALESVCVLLVAAEHVRRPGQQLKISRRESLLLITAHQRLERLAPGVLRVGLTALRELGCCHAAILASASCSGIAMSQPISLPVKREGSAVPSADRRA